MTTKLCIACEEEPRMVLPTGKLGPMCKSCQRDHDDNMRTTQSTRFCKTCRTNKPGGEFMKHGRVCASCRAAASVPVKTDMKRVCTGCQAEKPITDFSRQGLFVKPICKACFAADKQGIGQAAPAPHVSQPQILIVDRERGQILRCQVLSEVPTGVKHLDLIVEFYERQGCRIVDAVERVAEVTRDEATFRSAM